MKKLIPSLLTVFLLLSLAACSNGSSKNKENITEIDAVKASEQISPVKYKVEMPEQNRAIWIDDALCLSKDRVYYIGSDSAGAYVCYYDTQSSLSQVLYFFPDQMLRDVTVSSEGEIYILALPADESHSGSIIEIDANGKLNGNYMLDELDICEESSIREIEFADGVFYILSNEHLTAAELGTKLKKLYALDVEAGAKMTVSKDGRLILGQDKDGKYCLYNLNSKEQTLEAIAVFNMSFSRIAAGQTWDIYLDDSNDLYGYRLEDNTFEKIFSWNGLSITGGAIIETENNKLICTGKIGYDKPTPLLTLVPKEDTSEGATILIATTNEYGLDYRIQEAIRQWNLEYPQYPIEVVNYSSYSDGTDNRAAQMKLAADIISGKIPDIYDFSMASVDTIPSAAQYARRGLLEDLYPYFDNDPELSRGDFFSGILESLEINGGLYELVPEYSLLTTFASSRDVGDKKNWTYKGLNSIVEQSDYYESLFDERNDRMFLLGNIIDASGKKLIDWSTGECHFDSAYFKDLLETIKKMPEYGVNKDYTSVIKEVQDSKGLLYYMNMRDIWMVSTAPQAYGESYCLPGLPEVGNVIYPLCSFGISAYSENKEQCWEFLRQFVTQEYNGQFFLSPRIDGMQAQYDRAWQNVEDVADAHPYGRAAMQEILDILEKVDTAARHDAQIWQIVCSEVGAYFADQRSIEDTMNLIQSRVSIYMAEQS